MTAAASLDGRVAVVTGGASGIGRRVAELFASEGSRVVVGDRNEELLAETRAAIGPDMCSTAVVDVTSEHDVDALVALAVERYGRLDIGVNSAGIGTMAPIHQHPVDSWKAVLDVCLTGVFLSVRAETAQMIAQGSGGAVVNIASLNARQAAEGMSAYCSAKAGVEMLTKVAAIELGRYGIRINAVSPGFVDTPLTAPTRGWVRDRFIGAIPMGRAGTTDDIARAVLFLASDNASWVNGEALLVDGGEVNREYPRLLTGG
jgi:NAD(P)-dependent dehydrogenase (short-subunit alcohol dehydrogenase family)